MICMHRKIQSEQKRKGAAVVEFAVLAPIFLLLALGTIEAGQALEASNVLSAAIREGGRLAAMDWGPVVNDGQTPNQKVIQDIRNFIKAAGMPADSVTITLTHADGVGAGQPFDLSDPDNRLALFKITATLDYEAVSTFPVKFMEGKTLKQSLVMRAGKLTLVQ